VVVVEWADRIDYARYDGLCIHFEYRGDTCRELVFSARGEKGERLLHRFCRHLKEVLNDPSNAEEGK
jgi:tRNA A37 threonylcarbamoyladenosine biosynthesis protein TsaE